MRLKQKQFIPFMVVIAIITIIVIVYSSFNFMQKQRVQFKESIAASDSLDTYELGVVGKADSVKIKDFRGHPMLLVFWSTWSDKSESLLTEIQRLELEMDSLEVLAAIVKDAEESLPDVREYPEFLYVDGASLYNHLKVPGIPSYILFGENGNLIHAHIGYQKGAGYDTLKYHLNK